MNSRLLRNGLACLAFLVLPAAARAAADATPPVLVKLTFAPGVIDVSSLPQAVTIAATVTDNYSGVQSIECVFVSQLGNESRSVTMDSSDLLSGNLTNGVFSTTLTFGTDTTPGKWTLNTVQLTDQCGNTVSYAPGLSKTTLAFPPGTPTTLTVVSSSPTPTLKTAAASPSISSTSPPVITGFTFTPTTVDLTTTNSVDVVVTLTGSNLAGFDVEFVNHSSYGYKFESFYAAGPSATTITGTVNFSTCDATGPWKLEYIDAYNSDSSYTEYSSPNFPPGIPVTKIIVNNPGVNTTPPVLSSFILSSTAADISNGSVIVPGTVVASDTASGVTNGYGEFTGPNGYTIEFDLDSSYQSNPVLSGSLQGEMTIDSCLSSGTYVLSYFYLTDACGNETYYNGSSNYPYPGGNTPSIVVINGTASSGTLTVNLLPSDATQGLDASWYLDSGTNNLESGGASMSGIPAGPHVVNFTAIPGYTTPSSQNLLISGGLSFTSGTYVSTTPGDSIQVNLLPVSLSGSAQWNVDGGPLQASGATVSGLIDGPHTIQFSDILLYNTPATQTVTTFGGATTITSGTYTNMPTGGSVTVTIQPYGAVYAGAAWNIDGGFTYSGSRTVSGLVGTQHTITFSGGGASYTPPASQNFTITTGGTTSVTGTYAALPGGSGSLLVNIVPLSAISAQWDVDGGALQLPGATVAGLSAGSHTVSFHNANGYLAPGSQIVTVLPYETISTTGTYAVATAYAGPLQPYVGLSSDRTTLLSVNVGKNGKFSGKIIVASVGSYSIGGSFTSSANFVGQTPIPYSLQFSGTSPGTTVLTGSAKGQFITAYPAAYSAAQPATPVKYTALLTGTDPSATIPQGDGYFTLSVGKTGGGSITGKLADGTSFSASSVIVAGTAGKELVVFDNSIYGKQGLLIGILTLGTPAAGQFTGPLFWEKPGTPGAYYANGFSTNLTAAGALFDKTKPLPFTSGTIAFSAGGLFTPVTAPFTLGAKSVTISSPSGTIKLAVNASTAAVTGSVQPIGATKPIPFSALLIQDPIKPRAAGYFLSPIVQAIGLSGKVTLP
jgi:hypothetical protein